MTEQSNLLRRGLSAARCADMPRTFGFVAAAALMLASASIPAFAIAEGPPVETPGQSRILDGVVAVVDGDPITLRELKRYGVTGAPFLPPDVRSDFRALLESMIEHRLLKFEFEKNGVVATDEMVNRYISGVIEESKQTRAGLEADIARAGLTWKDYFERMRDEVQRIQLVNLLIRSRVNIPEEEVRRVWESDPQYVESEKLEVGIIFIPSPLSGEEADKGKVQAVEVRKEAGRNFEAAAKKYSKGPAASEGGRIGEFKRGTMAAHFEKALKGLDEGDVSEPVEGPGGFYIVKLIDIKSSGRRPFEEVKEELTEKLYEQRLNERFQKWATEDLRKDHHVDIMVDRLALMASTTPAPAAQVAPAVPALPGLPPGPAPTQR